MEQLVETEIVESLAQYVSVWGLLVSEFATADVSDRSGVSIRWADNPFPFWNAVFLNGELTDPGALQARLKEAADYVRAKRHPGLIYVCEDYVSAAAKRALPKLLSEEGLEAAIPVTGMTSDAFPLQQSSPPFLQIERVTSEAMLREYANINCEAYGFPLESGRTALHESRLWNEDAYAFLGYKNGRAVSGASVIVHDGYLYLALVATRPKARNKGYAEALVRHALQTAYEATKISRTILHATDQGYRVYRHVGYHPTARFMTYKVSENS